MTSPASFGEGLLMLGWTAFQKCQISAQCGWSLLRVSLLRRFWWHVLLEIHMGGLGWLLWISQSRVVRARIAGHQASIPSFCAGD